MQGITAPHPPHCYAFLFFLPPHIPTDRLAEAVVWGGALVRGAEFRKIHLYGKNFKSTPAHQTEPLRMATPSRPAQTTKSNPPDHLPYTCGRPDRENDQVPN